MSEYLRRNVLGVVAIFIALSGTAAALPGKNKVDSGDIKNANVKLADLGPNSVDGSKVADDSLKGADVDETSLNIPQQALPTSLPPSGAAGGDLSGAYPDPQVRESGLTAGGDLTGALSAASIANNTIGAAEPGVANDEIADGGIDGEDVLDGSLDGDDLAGNGSIGPAELQDRSETIQVPIGEIAATGLQGAGSAQLGTIGQTPSILFDPNSVEDAEFAISVPFDRVPGGIFLVNLLWSGNGNANVRWRLDGASIGPDVDQADEAFVNLDPAANDPTVAANRLRITNLVLDSNSIGNGHLLVMRLVREATNAGDTLAADAALHGVNIVYTGTG